MGKTTHLCNIFEHDYNSQHEYGLSNMIIILKREVAAEMLVSLSMTPTWHPNQESLRLRIISATVNLVLLQITMKVISEHFPLQ